MTEQKEIKVLEECVDNCPYNLCGIGTCTNGLSENDFKCKIKMRYILKRGYGKATKEDDWIWNGEEE